MALMSSSDSLPLARSRSSSASLAEAPSSRVQACRQVSGSSAQWIRLSPV